MKTQKNTLLHIQAYASDNWRDVIAFVPVEKKMALDLLAYKKKSEKQVKWRLIQRTIKEKKVA